MSQDGSPDTLYREPGDLALLDTGPSAGPGRTLIWAIDYFTRSVFRSRTAGKIAKPAFFWVQYFDHVVPESYAIDGASGVYFLGTKSNDEISADLLIENYRGAQ